MSQSPGANAASTQVKAYDNAWSALNTMIREGRSFSGRERNCAFLNLGEKSGRFANISAASGLDLIDDGRALALADWDDDGDVDLWMTNRTGPRLRFIRNDSTGTNGFVSIRLQGTDSNRDAIGAAVELHTTSGLRLKTVRAGAGHLGQSTKSLHFGLGGNNEIKRAVVFWPGGQKEEFTGLKANGRYLLLEGAGEAKIRPASTGVATFEPSTPNMPTTSDAGRIVVLSPLLTPELPYQNLGASEAKDLVPLVKVAGKPVLLNLWATWCEPCKHEMTQWTEAAQDFEASGLRVVSISVDAEEDRSEIPDTVQKLNYPFEVGIATDELVENLETLQRTFVGRQRDLPVPSSFLLDGEGRIAVIYRGPVDSAQILKDMELLGAPPKTIVSGAVPFAGKWLGAPRASGMGKLAMQFLKRGNFAGSERYLERLFRYAELRPDRVSGAQAGKLRNFYGAVLFDQGRPDDAVREWEKYISSHPDDRETHSDLARAYTDLGDIPAAIVHLKKALELRRADPATLAQLARLLVKQGNVHEACSFYAESIDLAPIISLRFEYSSVLTANGKYAPAIEQLHAMLKQDPNFPPACNNLAWLLATVPDEGLRDGHEAIRLAAIASAAAGDRLPSVWGTMAVAQAEIGDFTSALTSIKKARSLLGDEGGEQQQQYKEMEALFANRKPFRIATE